MSKPPSVRDALTFSARLFRSGHRSDETAALITLTREHYRLLAEVERKRDDCREWRRLAIMYRGMCDTLIRLLTRW